MLSLLVENVVGIQFNACLRENFTKYFQSNNECNQFRQLLLLNFLFRLNYYFLRRMDFLNKRISQEVLLKYTNRISKFLIKFTGVFTMLIYILLSLWTEPQSVITMIFMILIIILVCGITHARIKYSDELVFQKITQNYFKLLLVFHTVLTIFLYGARIFLFYFVNKFDESSYTSILSNHIFSANLNKNKPYTKQDFITYSVESTHANFNVEAVKTIILVLAMLIVNNSGMFIAKQEGKKLNIQYVIVIIFSLFFIFYVLTIYYMINVPQASQILLSCKFIFIAMLLIFVILILYHFYKISKKYNFKSIIEQEMIIFREVFVKDIYVNYFKDSICESDYFNEKYYFLKKIYRSNFVDNIKTELLGSINEFLKLYFCCFILFWIGSLLCQNFIYQEDINITKLIIELAIIFILFVLIYLLTIATSSNSHRKKFNNPSLLLLKINAVILDILKTKNVKKYEIQLKDYDKQLEAFMDENLDIIVKHYKPELYNQFILDLPEKLAKINRDTKTKTENDISNASDYYDKELELTELPKLEAAKSLYQFYKPQQKLKNYQYQRLNASEAKKLVNLPKNRKLLLRVIFLYSSYDVLKEMILNLYILCIAYNVNGVSLVLVCMTLGAPFVFKMRFWRLLTFMCFSLLLKTLYFFYMTGTNPNIIKLYLKIYIQNSVAFNIEFVVVGLSIFLFVPTFLLIKTIFSEFSKSKTDFSEKNIAWKGRSGNTKTININYYNWNRLGKNWLTYLHRFLILKGRYILPVIFFTIAMYDETQYMYFKLYIVYSLFYFMVIDSKLADPKANQLFKSQIYFIFRIFVFLYYIGLICGILFGSLYTFNKDIMVFIFILHSKNIINNSLFCKFDKSKIKEASLLHKELCMYLINIDNNEKLILQKINQQIKYYKILKFTKYSAKDNYFSLNNLTKTNLSYFSSIFGKNYLLKAFLYFHFKSYMIYWEDPFCLLMILKSKYNNIIDLDLNINELLNQKYGSGIEMIGKINALRNMIHNKHISVVSRSVNKLKVLENETDETLTEKAFDELDIKNFEDCETPEAFKEQVKPVLDRFMVGNNTEGNYNLSSVKTKFSPAREVIVYNYKYNHIIDQDGQPKIDFISIFKAIYSFLHRKSDKFILFYILYLLLFHYGVLSFVLIPLILFTIAIDKSEKHKIPKLLSLYFFMFFILLVKQFTDIFKTQLQDHVVHSIIFMTGDIANLKFDIIILFMLFCLIRINSKRCNKNYFPKKEFPGEAAYRITLNDDLNTLDTRYNFNEAQLIDYFCKNISAQTLNKKKTKYLEGLQLYLKEILEMKSKIKANSAKVIETLKLFNSINNYEKYESFLWRNFSYQNINYGKDHLKYKIYIILLFIFQSGYYFFVYKKRYTYDSIKEFLNEKSLDGTFVLILTFSLLIILYDIIFYNYQSITWNRRIRTCNILTVNTAFERSKLLTAKERFIKYVKYVIWVKFLANNAYKPIKIHKDYRYNTYKKKYLVNISTTLLIMVLFLFWLPSFDEDLIRYSIYKLVRSPIDPQLRLLLFLFLFYILVDILDSNIDKINNYDSILNTNFKSRINSYIFKIYVAIPFIMEIKAILHFISAKTSLNILKWYRIEDIKRILINAKFINEGMKRKIVGKHEPWYMRLIFAQGFFLLFYLILIAPLFIFSTSNPLVADQEIIKAEFSVMVKTIEDNIYQNPISIAKISQFKVENAKNKDFGDENYNDPLNTLMMDKVKKIESLVSSSKLYDYSSEGFQELKNRPIEVLFDLKITVNTKANLNVSTIVDSLNDMTVDDKSLMNFLSFDCKTIEEHIETQDLNRKFYIGRLYNYFETSPDGQLIQKSLGHSQKKIYLNSRCYKGQKYYTLSFKDEKPLFFLIYLRDIGGEHLVKRIRKNNSSVI